MALHKIEVDGSGYYYLRHDRSWVEFVQLYACQQDPSKIIQRENYWTARSFGSDKELALNIVRQDFIDSVKRDLMDHAVEMHFKGFTANGFGIKLKSSGQVYALDAFDVKHVTSFLEAQGLGIKKPVQHSSPEL